MIFPVLETEDVVQINDMTRISAVKSFISKDEAPITKVEIQPESGGDWIDVTGANLSDWYLDWLYTGASRSVIASVRITTTAAVADPTVTFTGGDNPLVDANNMATVDIDGNEPGSITTVPGASNMVATIPATSAASQADQLIIQSAAGPWFYLWLDIDSDGTGPSSSGGWYTPPDADNIFIRIPIVTGATASENAIALVAAVTANSDWVAQSMVAVHAGGGSGAVTQTATKTIAIKSAVDDNLFSGDQDLLAFEPDILKWVPAGRASFLNIHRAAKMKILESLDESGIVGASGAKLTDAAVVDKSEVRAWSRDKTLALIFKGLINQVDDVFTIKSKYYEGEAGKRKQRAVLRLDLDGDGEISTDESSTEGVSMQSMTLIRT